MPRDDSLWFRLGYAAERALLRGGVGDVEAWESGPRSPRRPRGGDGAGDPVTRILSAGAGAVVTRLLRGWDGDKGPGWGSLVRAGAAGASVALLVELTRLLLVREELELNADLAGEALAGAGAGLVYATLVEPRVPGPLILRGAVYGTAEYLTGAWGGLGGVLGPLTPQERLPLVGALLTEPVAEGRSYLEHLLFAVALAELYGEG